MEVARPFNNPNAPLSEGEASPLWSRLCPGILIGRGLARIARLLRGKAPWGAGIACTPPRTPRRGATREGGGSGGSDPGFFGAGAPPGRGWCTPKSTTFPPLFGVAPSTVIPAEFIYGRCNALHKWDLWISKRYPAPIMPLRKKQISLALRGRIGSNRSVVPEFCTDNAIRYSLWSWPWRVGTGKPGRLPKGLGCPRDRFICWSRRHREKNLPLVVDNPRFLILPWIRIPNLGSHILALVRRQLPADWTARYKTTPVLIETFVEPPATPAPSTGPPAGSASAPPRGADATAPTTPTTSPPRTPGCGPSARTGSAPSTGRIKRHAPARPNGYYRDVGRDRTATTGPQTKPPEPRGRVAYCRVGDAPVCASRVLPRRARSLHALTLPILLQAINL